MQSIRVLIFPCGSEIAMEINTSLSNCVNIELYGASSRSDHGEYVYKNYIGQLPYVSDKTFLPIFNRNLIENKIDIIFPTHDTVALYLAANKDNIHAQTINSDLETCRICRNKREIYRLFAKQIFCPTVYNTFEEVKEFPVFIKPNQGEGGKNSKIINDKFELEKYFDSSLDHLILEYLPGDELSVDCFTDRKGQLRYVGPRTRSRILAGISTRSTSAHLDDEHKRIAETINKCVNLNGAWFFQLKRDKFGRYKLLEFAPRIASTMSVYRMRGVNFPLLSVYNILNQDIDILDIGLQIELDKAFISRYKINFEFNTIYLDLDDTLISNSQVNTLAIMFVYHMKNLGKNIILLTAHKGNLIETLHRYRICECLFDKIIHLEIHQQKADSIDPKQSIFIDNSFKERFDVFRKTGIPVFDLDAISGLIDWRKL